MAKPITHELQHIWITADGKKFLNEDDAKKHQLSLIELEKEDIKEEIQILKNRLREFEENQSTTSDDIDVVYNN